MAQQQKQGSEEVPALPHGSAARTFHDQQGTVLGCAHYQRRQAPACLPVILTRWRQLRSGVARCQSRWAQLACRTWPFQRPGVKQEQLKASTGPMCVQCSSSLQSVLK